MPLLKPLMRSRFRRLGSAHSSRARAALKLPLASLAATLVFGCANFRNGADGERLWTATQQYPAGANVYRMDCAHCHGLSGAGLDGRPRVMGPGALPQKQRLELEAPTELARAGRVGGAEGAVERHLRRRQDFRTAADLYAYIRTRMPAPYVSEGSLSEPEYWAVLNYILTAHGVSLPEGGVDASNAERVSISR